MHDVSQPSPDRKVVHFIAADLVVPAPSFRARPVLRIVATASEIEPELREDLEEFNNVVDRWRRDVANAPRGNDRLNQFGWACRAIAPWAHRGIERPDVVDAMHKLGMDHAAAMGCSAEDIEREIRECLRDADAQAERNAPERVPDPEQKVNGHDKAFPKALPFTKFGDITADVAKKSWVIKGVLAEGEISSWFGPPGGIKSTTLGDIAVHAGAGRDWRGYKSKGPCGVVVFALERGKLFERRLLAQRIRDNLHGLPIAVVSKVIDMMKPACVEAILDTIGMVEQAFGVEVKLAIFDTYSKGIAAGGGDEDKARDQNIVSVNLRRLIERKPSLHCATVGHTGKDESKGERGSNAKLGDNDVSNQFNGDVTKTITITTIKANDQPLGTVTTLRTEPQEICRDEDGDPVSVFIVAPYEREEEATTKPSNKLSRRVKLPKVQARFFKILREAVTEAGEVIKVDRPQRLPADARAVTREMLRNYLTKAAWAGDKSPGAWRAAVSRNLDEIEVKGLIGLADEYVWLAVSE